MTVLLPLLNICYFPLIWFFVTPESVQNKPYIVPPHLYADWTD